MVYSFNSYYLDTPLVKGRVFDVFFPEKVEKDTQIFIVHGGGWTGGSRASFHKIMQKFNERGYITATTDYRLYAKDAFEQISDVRDAYSEFVKVLKSRGIEPKVAVYGESAGAHLASLISYTNPGECGEKSDITEWVKPAMVMLQATPVDFSPREEMSDRIRSAMQHIAGASYEKCPEIYERLSLKNYVREDNPITFFLEAECESLFPSDATKKIVDRHHDMGIASCWKVYEKMEHGFFYDLTRKGQRDAFSDICDFIENGTVSE